LACGYLSPQVDKAAHAFSGVLDWRDFAVLLCMLLVVLGAGALAVAAQTFTIVRGKVLEKGTALLDLPDGNSYSTRTISVLIENDDRIFRIERGTIVKYAVSDHDARLVDVGSDIELLISSYGSVARVIGLGGSSSPL
jgi:stage V sporulation protein SpoVS